MNPKKIKLSVLVSAFVMLFGVVESTRAQLAVTTAGSGAAGTFQVTLPAFQTTLTSNVGSGTVVYLALKNVSASGVGGSQLGSGSFTGTFSDGSNTLFSPDELRWAAVNAGVLTTADVRIGLGTPGIALSSGTTITSTAGTFSMAATSGFVDFSSGSYQAFLVSGNYSQLSANAVSAVPEPSTYAIVSGILALGCTVVVRRRKTRLAAAT